MTQDDDATPSWTTGVERVVLPNGLTVLVQRDELIPAVAAVTHVKAGFFDEPDHWVGISHVLEHMFFKGTPTRGVGQIASETKALGGYLNASTSYDYTEYYVVLPAAGATQALEIQADALRHSLIDGAELARELQVIIQEAKRKLDTPSAVASETLNEVMFDRHRIRRWRIGTEAMLAGFTRDDLLGYYRSRYVPERVIISVVGAVDVAATIRTIERLYGDWQAPFPGFEPGPTEGPHHGVRVRTIRGDVQQAELAVGWPGVGPLHPDAAPLDVAALVLSAGRGSWLYRLLRQPGTVTSIGAYHYSPTELGVFAVSADLETTAIEAALAGIGSAVAHLADTGPEALDLERAKTLFRARWARRFETADGRAATFAHAEALGGLAILDREYREALAVTAEDVVRVARAYLRPDSASGVAFLPNDRGAPLEAADVAQILSRPPRFPLQAVPAPALVVPPPAVIRGAHTAGVTHWAAPHADLLVRPKSGVPLVTLGLYRRRATTETMEEAGLGTLAMRSLARGAGGYDAEQLAAIFETMGGTLSTSVNADWFGVGTTVLADHAQEAALMLRAVLESPHYRDDDVERERRILHDEVRQVTDDMFRYPVQLAFSQAFHWKGYGVPVLGWPDTVERLSSEAVRRWHQRELTGGRTVAVVAGDVVPDEMLGALASILERPIASGFTAAPAAAAGTVALPDGVVTRLKNQSAVAMVFPGPSRRAQDRHAAMVWAGVASGLGGRLFTVLRDQRSLAYTVMATSWQRRDAGALVTYIATSPEREEEARASMLEELARFAREPVAADELERAVNYLAGQTEVQRQSMGSLAAEIVDAWLVGTGLEELEDPIAPFRAVTREDVHQVANRYLDPGARTEGVVRGTVGGR